MNWKFILDRGASLFKVRNTAPIVSDPDVDGSLFVAGLPGWIYPCGLSVVIIVAAAMDVWHDAHAAIKENGTTYVTALGVMLGSFLSYRGYRGHLRARTAEAQINAQVSLNTGTAPPAASTTTTTVTTGPAAP